MNNYVLTFPFKGEYHFITLTANQMANQLLPQDDSLFDFYEQNPGENVDDITIWHDGKRYGIDFYYKNPRLLDVYIKSDNEEEDGRIVKGDGEKIPWQLVKIATEEGKDYNLSDFV